MNSLAPSLERLETAQLIRALTDPEQSYFFRHILIQESAYDTLLRHERKSLHKATALTLEYQGAASPGELARHFMAAEMPDLAAEYFTLAARRAQSRFENAEAISFFRAALEQEARRTAPLLRPQIELYEGMSDVLSMMRKTNEALSGYSAALDLAQDSLSRARLVRKIGDVHQLLLDYQASRLAYERALVELGPMDDSRSAECWQEWILIMVGAMNNNYWHGHWQEVKRLIDEASPAVACYGTPMLRAMYLDRVEMMHARRNRYIMDDETRDLVIQMMAAADESQDPQQILNAHFSLAFVDLRRMDLEAAEKEFLWSIEYAQELGAVMYLLWSMTYLAVLYRWRGDIPRMRTLIESAQRLEGAKDTPWYAAGLANLAWAALRRDDTAQTYQLAHAALEMWKPFGELYPFKTLALFPLLELARRDKKSDRAVECLVEIQNPSQEKLDDALDHALTCAQNAFAAGDTDLAWRELDCALAQAKTLGLT